MFSLPNVNFSNDMEGFGMTQLEMYSGMPVVAFVVHALVESIRKGGYLIEPGNYQAFADAVNRYLSLPEKEKQEKRKEASEYVRREYSWDSNAAEYQKLFFNSFLL
ncbi:hypothetical protein CHISP_1019 [Chitinispirillum alkaliphilum]|nr:hypothetical protein CHISP_1019 [Chitinispirillum alkaliphilum]